MAKLMLHAQKHMNAKDEMTGRRDQGNELRKLSKRKRDERLKRVDDAARQGDNSDQLV